MALLITILISILGFGTPDDFDHLSEAQLEQEIQRAEAHAQDGGTFGDWEVPGVTEEDPQSQTVE